MGDDGLGAGSSWGGSGGFELGEGKGQSMLTEARSLCLCRSRAIIHGQRGRLEQVSGRSWRLGVLVLVLVRKDFCFGPAVVSLALLAGGRNLRRTLSQVTSRTDRPFSSLAHHQISTTSVPAPVH